MSSNLLSPVAMIFLALLVGLGVVLVRGRRRLPPGPSGLPVLGNMFQIPARWAWFYFSDLGKKYGPIMGFSIIGDRVLVLNRGADADELLGKRAIAYSSRPRLIFASKYWSQSKRLIFLSYGEELKRLRSAFHHMLQPRTAGAYEVYQEMESAKLLSDMLTKPEDSFFNVKRYAAALIYTLTYGRWLQEEDADLKNILNVIFDLNEHSQPGAHLVDSLPVLDILPDILAPWRKQALRGHEAEAAIYDQLSQDVARRISNGEESLECFVARLWEQKDKLGLDNKSVAYLAGTAFEAGAGTTSAQVLWFLAAALLYPETIRLAHEEIHSVVDDRAPNIQDMKNLPYCSALVKEVLRWAPSVPGGVAHCADKDDEYQGYYIEKGTTVIPNIWGMHHDEEIYPNPNKFEPARFFKKSDVNSSEKTSLLEGHWGFGFGRRICPGRALGATGVWIAVVRLIWAFDILPVLDDAGKPLLPSYTNWTPGLICEPEMFRVKLIPRTEKLATTVRRQWEDIVSSGYAVVV